MVMDLTKATGPHEQPPTLTAEPEFYQGGDPGAEDRPPPRKKQRKKPREDEKVCRVCGDKALAHNFDAITCESCKAFFRRNALRTERNPCMFRGDCPVTVQTRRFCPACRLRKCFEVGMKAELILDDRERRARMEKVSENRAKRIARESTDDSSDAQVGSSCQSVIMPTATERYVTGSSPASTSTSGSTTTIYMQHDGDAELQHQLSRDDHVGVSHIRSSINSAAPQTVLQLLAPATQRAAQPSPSLHHPQLHQHLKQDLSPLHQHQHHLRGSSSSILTPEPQPASSSAAHAQGEFQHVSRDLLPSDPHMYWRLSEEEKTLLTQLSSAYQDIIMTLPEREPCPEGSCRPGEPRSIESIFETGEKNMRQLIAFVQRLGDFHLLREDDKIATLQLFYAGSALYVVERDTWLSRFGENTVAMTAAIFGNEDVIRCMANFCRSLKIILKNDVTLYVLMHCLILFDPREPNIVDRQLINTFRDKYVILLKHYLESEYSFLYSERYLRAIMDKTVEIRHVAEQSIGVMRQFKDFLTPLMKQLFNLDDIV
nr:hypothetical protein BaRGS_018400 [Batillaria attramentaria]